MNSHRRKTVAVLIDSPLFLEHLFLSGALRDLVAQHDVVLAGPADILELWRIDNEQKQRHNVPVRTIEISRESKWLSFEKVLLDVNTRRYQNRSQSFVYRLQRERLKVGLSVDSAKLQLTCEERHSLLGAAPMADQVMTGCLALPPPRLRSIAARGYMSLKLVVRVFQSTRRRKVIFRDMLARPPLHPCLMLLSKIGQKWANQAVSRLGEMGIDLALIPTSGFEPHLRPLLRSLREGKIASALVVDNWDNLSSKIVLLEQPNAIGVWGPQSAHHAEDIHGIEPGKIYELGSPRFVTYAESETTSSAAESRSILFSGSAPASMETPLLRVLDHVLEGFNEGRLDGEVRLIYRPHPFRAKRTLNDEYNASDYRFVDLEDAGGSRDTTAFREKTSIDFARYLFVVSGPTSVVIESLIHQRNVILLGLNDKLHLTTGSAYIRNSLHFAGIAGIPAVSLVATEEALAEEFTRLLTRAGKDSHLSSQKSVEWYCTLPCRDYGKRLLAMVNEVLQTHE